jgi:hypothetical protein
VDRFESQVYKTTDILSIFLAAVLVIVLFFRIGWNYYDPNFFELIKAEAEVNAYQVWEIEKRNLKKRNLKPEVLNADLERGLASEASLSRGMIGEDPWNRPFFYQVQKVDEHTSQIVIWSFGLDGKSDSDISLPNFSGDDIGQVVSINP